MTSNTRLAFPERLKIYELLKTVCVKNGDGFVHYNPGWNDERVAKAVGGKALRTHVKSIRTETLGATRVRGQNKPKDETNAEIEHRLTQIEEYLTRKNPGWNA